MATKDRKLLLPPQVLFLSFCAFSAKGRSFSFCSPLFFYPPPSPYLVGEPCFFFLLSPLQVLLFHEVLLSLPYLTITYLRADMSQEENSAGRTLRSAKRKLPSSPRDGLHHDSDGDDYALSLLKSTHDSAHNNNNNSNATKAGRMVLRSRNREGERKKYNFTQEELENFNDGLPSPSASTTTTTTTTSATSANGSRSRTSKVCLPLFFFLRFSFFLRCYHTSQQQGHQTSHVFQIPPSFVHNSFLDGPMTMPSVCYLPNLALLRLHVSKIRMIAFLIFGLIAFYRNSTKNV